MRSRELLPDKSLAGACETSIRPSDLPLPLPETFLSAVGWLLASPPRAVGVLYAMTILERILANSA